MNATFNEFVQKTAATVRSYDGLQDLENAVWETVCGLDTDELKQNVDESDDWKNTGHSNNAWTECNAPNFADAQALGDWDGFDVADIQELCQEILNVIVERDGNPDEQ